MANLKCILSAMESLTNELYELDNDWERSANIKRSITASIRPYSKILNERKQKSKQLKLDTFSEKFFETNNPVSV